MKLVSKAEQALKNITILPGELAKTPNLVDRLGRAHAWYIDARDLNCPVFGFSKFVGYKDITGAKYLEKSKGMDGRNTEAALKKFSEELRPESLQYKVFHNKLIDWLAEFGKTLRKRVRLMIVKADLEHVDETEDRRLLDLHTAVADILPLDQRLELRSRL